MSLSQIITQQSAAESSNLKKKHLKTLKDQAKIKSLSSYGISQATKSTIDAGLQFKKAQLAVF